MTSGASSHAHINIVLSIVTPEALLVGEVKTMVGCLAPKIKMAVFARFGDEPMAVSIHTVLNKDLFILDCQ